MVIFRCTDVTRPEIVTVEPSGRSSSTSSWPIVQSVPMELRAKLEPAELYHEVLEHRWFLSEAAGREISMEEAAQSYMNTVLRGLPDEAIAVSAMESMGPLANPFDPSLGFADEEYERPYDPWEDEASAPEPEEPWMMPGSWLRCSALSSSTERSLRVVMMRSCSNRSASLSRR